MKNSLRKKLCPSESDNDMILNIIKFYLGAALGLLYAPIFYILCGPLIKVSNIFANWFEIHADRIKFAAVLLMCISLQIRVMLTFFMRKIRIKSANLFDPKTQTLKCWANKKLALEIDDFQKDRVLGLCFIMDTFDRKQLEENIEFFSQYCGSIILIKNGKKAFNFEISSPHKIKTHEIYNRDFQSCFVDVMNKYQGYKIIKFDDDDLYLNGCVEQLVYSQKVSGCECISLKPLIYHFEHENRDTDIFVSRRFLFPIILSKKMYKISGTLLYFSDKRRNLTYEFPSKYLDQSLNTIFSDRYAVCATFFIIVRRIFWRRHASDISSLMMKNLIKFN